MRYLFGPVLSRRLGRSLGIDLVRPKICSMNCIYCECGKTTQLTRECREYVPVQAVIDELDTYLRDAPPLDYITFSGSGEPTLNSGIGRVIAHIKEHYPRYKLCLLTNATQMDTPERRAALAPLDLIVPSLDAVFPDSMQRINRQSADLTPEMLIEWIAAFKHDYPAVRMNLELFIVPSINDSAAEIEAFARAIARIRPDCVQLNSLDRPGCVDTITRPSPETFAAFDRALSPIAPVQVIGKIDFAHQNSAGMRVSMNLGHMLCECASRRPCTVNDFCALTALSEQTVLRELTALCAANKMVTSEEEGRTFYRSIEG